MSDKDTQSVILSVGEPSVRVILNLRGERLDFSVTPVECYEMWLQFDNMKAKLEEKGLL